MIRHLAFLLALSLASLGGCGVPSGNGDSDRVNGPVHVSAGKPAGVAETVNGGIDIDADAAVTTAKTVNGGIRLGVHATADSLGTVNGSVTLDSGARVSGSVETVNGGITLRDGADVAGRIENVNGNIELAAAQVGGGIRTIDGNIDIHGNSRVEKGILVQKAGYSFFHFGNDTPRIVIGPGSTVDGDLRFERHVQLYVSDRATIGHVVGATAIRFAGDAPSN